MTVIVMICKRVGRLTWNIEARKCLLSFSWKRCLVLISSVCTSLKVPAISPAFFRYC